MTNKQNSVQRYQERLRQTKALAVRHYMGTITCREFKHELEKLGILEIKYFNKLNR